MNQSACTLATTTLKKRVNALVGLYQQIGLTRMAGIPLLNPALHVQAVGFEVLANETSSLPSPAQPGTRKLPVLPAEMPAGQASGLGILITPWFMSLLCLPLMYTVQTARVGIKTSRYVGQTCFEFMLAHEEALGSYETCSLFSPVFEFSEQATAVATASTILHTLRQPVQQQDAIPEMQEKAQVGREADRRAFLFGRKNSAAAPARTTHV